MPTHFVTIQNADGSRRIINTAKDRYLLKDIGAHFDQANKVAEEGMKRDQHAATMALSRDELTQRAKDAAASRAIQGAHLALARQQAMMNTPAGQIASKEQAFGEALTRDQKAALLGLDTLPPAIAGQLKILSEDRKAISQAITKAQAEGTWADKVYKNKDDTVGKPNPLLVRERALQGQINQLLQPIPLVAATQHGQAGAQSPPASAPASALKPVGGIPRRESHTAGTYSATGLPVKASESHVHTGDGAVDVRNDPVLQQLRSDVKKFDPQNPAHTPEVMRLGTEINQRIGVLQEKYGRLTRLISQ